MNTAIATLALGIPTAMLILHAARSALPAARAVPSSVENARKVPLIDLPKVGIGFAASLIAVAVGRQLAGHELLKGIDVASLVAFCGVIGWGFWAQGTRWHWSSSLILLASATAGCLLGMSAPSW